MAAHKKSQPKNATRIFDSLVVHGIRVSENKWRLPNDNPATHDRCTTIDWNLELTNGDLLTSQKHECLLEEAKGYAAIALDGEDKSLIRETTTVVKYVFNLRPFLSWAIEEGLTSVRDLDEDWSWRYLDWVLDEMDTMQEDGGKGATFGAVYDRVQAVVSWYKRREAIEALGVAAIRAIPFDGRTAFDVVTKDLGLRKDGKLEPIPDDVVVPVLNSAIRLIGAPADDVIALQAMHTEICFPLRTQTTGKKEIYSKYNTALGGYVFATLEGEASPWHEPITGPTERSVSGKTYGIKQAQRVRRLSVAITTACLTVLQGLTGMRASELLGLRVEKIQDGLPQFVEKRLSGDGVLELWFIRGKVLKGRKREEEWIIGSRTVGSSYIPPTLRALEVLVKLMEPWRELSGRKELALTMSGRQGLPLKPSSIGRVTSMTMTTWMKEFVSEWCKLGAVVDNPEGVARGIRGHRWRPTFAQFLFRTEPKLLPAIADHYKHMEMAMVDNGYVGNNPAMLEAMDSGRTQFSARVLMSIARPDAQLGGAGAQLVRKHGGELRAQIAAMGKDSDLENAAAFVEQNELLIYRGAGGACLVSLSPSNSVCQRKAGISRFGAPVPVYEARSVENCVGCKLHVIMKSDRWFWESRLKINTELADNCRDSKEKGMFQLATRRANQARAILAAMEADRSGGECCD